MKWTHLQLNLYIKDIEGKPENVPFATSFPLFAGLRLCCIGQNQNLRGGRPNIQIDYALNGENETVICYIQMLFMANWLFW